MVTHHKQRAEFAHGRWEPYHVDNDFTESRDLAQAHPDKLRELVAATAGGIQCGHDDASPVSDRYVTPFTFTGLLHEVTVELGDAAAPEHGFQNLVALRED